MTDSILLCRGVSFRPSKTNVLEQVSFSLRPGRIAGLFGPYGSGKSSLLQIAAGRLPATSGEIDVCGHTAGRSIRAYTSYLPEHPEGFKHGRISTLVRQYRDLFPDWNPVRFHALLTLFDFPGQGSLKELAPAQIQQLGLCLCLARTVPLYLLDEPLSAMELEARAKLLREALAGRPAGSSALIATSQVQALEDLVDDALFLRKGRLSLSGDAASLRAEQGKSLNALYMEGFEWE